ncbi:T9SS type A sorting domain-containing protein [Hyunsoonleella sp. SJ7]|uniref:T9SS type A sorting domain-containing protein n=1 Tax=Hyunsoonleella aquatilis TaxID=2762758 RepID=A0A923KJS0_9FLAO|nr:T9SS type A sorting domain-containing protein [Hyunsoonleella aquatilis]MBC3757717.1 T9SS type A sorting domain-containing protein [Hyunsoonleella aquatilis]
MKQPILLLVFLFLSFQFSAYGQGPPPPCGFSPGYACNSDGSDFAVFNLRELYPFTFCNLTNQSDYHPVTYYETEGDRDNETNPISNPESYVNLTNPQTIYYRANKIVPDGNSDVAKGNNPIRAIVFPTVSRPTPLVACDANNDGIGEFNPRNKSSEILAGLDSLYYNVSYHETLEEAQNDSNRIFAPYTNTTNPQVLYARVAPSLSVNCSSIVELDLMAQGNCSDIAVYLTSQASPRPGFDYINYLVVKNKGANTTESGSVEFTSDGALNFIEATGVDAGNTITNTSTGFILNFNDLEVGEEENVKIKMNVPVPTPLGTLLTNTAMYLGSDILDDNNSSTLKETVIGSYDPNDILESHGPEIVHSEFTSDDYLYYTIRFQNVGTADAINVSIDNTLNADLDESTIQMLSGSHTNVFTRTGSQLNWQFGDIHLPSEDMDEPNSHGYVYYKIKPKAGYAVGDIIPNTAEIYFDFNPAVITNTFETEFIATLSNSGRQQVEFSMHPNPASSVVELQVHHNTNDLDVAIYSIQGKKVLSITLESTNKPARIDVSKLSEGLYFFTVNDGFAETTKKLVVE